MNLDETREPKLTKGMLAASNIQALNDVLHDPVWQSLTTTPAMYRGDTHFPEILRCFWTTICVLNGIEIDSTVYDCLLERLRDIYGSIGVEIDREFIGALLDFDDEPEDI